MQVGESRGEQGTACYFRSVPLTAGKGSRTRMVRRQCLAGAAEDPHQGARLPRLPAACFPLLQVMPPSKTNGAHLAKPTNGEHGVEVLPYSGDDEEEVRVAGWLQQAGWEEGHVSRAGHAAEEQAGRQGNEGAERR